MSFDAFAVSSINFTRIFAPPRPEDRGQHIWLPRRITRGWSA